MNAGGESFELRVLILTPTAKDAELTRSILGHAGVASVCCSDLDQICERLDSGAGAVLLAEEAIGSGEKARLLNWLSRQPPWSDLPLLVLARPGADSAEVMQAVELLGNVSVLERPIRVAALVSAVLTAVRSRQRQYQIRDHLRQIENNERELRAREERFRSMANTTPAIIWTADPNGAITFHNQRWLDYTGITPEQNTRNWPELVLHPHDRERCIELWQHALAEGTDYEIELRNRSKSGEYRWFLTRATPIRDADGRIVEWYGSTTDIHDRKQAEAALRTRARQQRAVARLGERALRGQDVQRLFDYASALVADTLEVEYCKVLELLPGGDQLLLRAGVGWRPGLVGNAMVGAGLDSQAGYTLAADAAVVVEDLRTEGRFHGPPLLFEHGVISGMSCIIRRTDSTPWGVLGTHATRRVDFTEDDVSFLAAVANILGDAIHRERAERELQDADRRKDEFLAILAHELRNPLAPIRNSLHILRLTGQSDPAAERVGEMMERQVNHMVRLVDDLLEVSRITRGKIELRKEPIELAAVVRSAVETSKPLVDAAGHQLAVTIPSEPLFLLGDLVRLSQVIANLLNNAAKYTEPGGQIWLKVRREADCVSISVRDTGIGIPSDMLPRVFDLFAQIDRHVGHSQGGLGIGLTLVKSLVEMHGGAVKVQSDGPGRGSEFEVRLPLVAGPQPDASSVSQKGLALIPRRVLVVDDNRDAADSLSTLLKLLGADVFVAYDGPEALAILGQYKPEVVLLDIGMPGMDGHEVARRIRQQPEFQDVTLIALTGWGQQEDRHRSESAGFDFHLIKPADVNVLQSLLLSLDPNNPAVHSTRSN